MYDIQEIRKDFPILGREVYGRPLVYLDNGATTQKPRCVVEAMTDEYYNVNANVHRGVHFLSQQATELHEAARETVRRFLNARSSAEIVFTRGTTESINLVASCFGEAFMREGDEVILSEMEHHSNIVSWQLLQTRKGIKLRVVPINDRGELMLDEYEQLFNDRTRIVSVTHVSNVLGTVNPVRRMIDIAHAHGVPVLVDGAQSAPHFAVDMQSLDADFFAFSGHKVYGPTGVGVLYGKEEWLDRLPPYMGGGEMIRHVTFGHTTFNGLPFKFEAGTPDYSIPFPPWAWTASTRTSRDWPVMPWSACAAFPACAYWARPASGTLSSPSWWAVSTTWTWARCSTAWASPCARATTAPSR